MKRNRCVHHCFIHIICLVAFFLLSNSSYAYVETTVNLTMSVKETKKLEVPTPSQGYIDYSKWTCDNSNVSILSESLGMAYVKVTKYFEGKATVQCLYVAKWYDDRGWTQQTTYLRNFVITCKPTEKNQVKLSISPEQGNVKVGTTVTITAEPSDAVIYYTTDGTTPSMNASLYHEPIVIKQNCIISAIGYHDDYEESEVINASYNISEFVEGENFSALTKEGIYLWYEITDAKNKICEVDELTKEDRTNPSITEITVPDTINGFCVKSIGNYAFTNSNIKSISLPENINRIGKGAFSFCSKLEYICIPHEVNEIDNSAFYDCHRLRKITIPYNSKLTYVRDDAFRYCENLETVFLPRMLEIIGESAFKGCTGIKYIYSDTTTPASVSSNSFDSQSLITATLYVSQDNLSTYKNRYVWKDFSSIKGMERQVFYIMFPDGPYKTFYDSQYSYVLSENMKAAIVTGFSKGKILYKIIADGQTDNDVIPAGTPVILFCRDRGCRKWSSYYGFPLHETTKIVEEPSVNMLFGSDNQCVTFSDYNKCDYYQLHNIYDDKDEPIWKWGADDGGTFNVEKNTAWMPIPYMNSHNNQILLMEEEHFRKGDVNLDEIIDISDIVAVINNIAGGNVFSHSDVNLDRITDISDIVAIINILANIDDPAVAGGYCPDSNHPHAIDLGVDVKWACCNVDASSPEKYGGYYSWGETNEKSYYDWASYLHCDGTSSTCHNLGKDISGTIYDVAQVKWNGKWHLPSKEQIKSLIYKCKSEETVLNNVKGVKFTGTNGNSIFLPAAGNKWHDEIYEEGSKGLYWSSSLGTENTSAAYYLNVENKDVSLELMYRYYSRSARPVIE